MKQTKIVFACDLPKKGLKKGKKKKKKEKNTVLIYKVQIDVLN